MMRSNKFFFLFFATAIFLLTSCKNNPVPDNVITVSIEPERYFAEKISKGKFTIHTMVPAGQNPENYEPTPSQMVKVGKSRAYFQIGYIGFEQAWMKNIKSNNPQLKLFNLSEGMPLIKSKDHHHGDHIHHGNTDPHLWNSIQGARVIAQNILRAFCSLDKENSSFYQQNYELLIQEIDQIGQQVEKQLRTLKNRTFIIYHPALTYFAKEFDLQQLCIEMEGKDPSPAQLRELIDVAKANQARIIFVQKEFDIKNASLISQETGCRLITINPLNFEWDKEMIQIAKALRDGETD